MRLSVRKKIIATLAAFIFFLASVSTCLFAFSDVIQKNLVKAESAEEIKYGLTDSESIYSWNMGASIPISTGQSLDYAMKFRLNLNKEDYYAFSESDQRYYSFTLYTFGADGKTFTPISEFIYLWVDDSFISFSKKISTAESTFMKSPCDFTTITTDIPSSNPLYHLPENLDPNYTINGKGTMGENYVSDFAYKSNDTGKYIEIFMNMTDPYVNYFIRFEYQINLYKGTEKYGFLNLKERKVYEQHSGAMDTDVRSICSVLKNIRDYGDLDTYFPLGTESRTSVENIIENEGKVKIKIKYLKEIPGTPFATDVEELCEVAVNSETITFDRIATALNRKSDAFSVFGNQPSFGFKLISASTETLKTFKADYGYNKWLSSKTADGNSANYFLSINQSYYEYYHRMTNENNCDGIIQTELYEYMLTKIKNKYPALNSFESDHIYGYFGYVVIPETYTLNSAWAECFNIDTKISGNVFTFGDDLFIVGQALTKTQYTTLLEKYKYSYLSRIWNNFINLLEDGSVNCTNYLFYCTTKNSLISIGENGADDFLNDNGAIKNDVDTVVNDFQTNISTFFENLVDSVSTVNLIIGMILVFSAGYLLIKLMLSFLEWLSGGGKKS